MPPNEPLGWFANIGTDFGAYLPQIRFFYAPISVPGSFGGTGSRKLNQYFLQCMKEYPGGDKVFFPRSVGIETSVIIWPQYLLHLFAN